MNLKEIERILSDSINQLNEINGELERREMISITSGVANELVELIIDIQNQIKEVNEYEKGTKGNG